MTAQETGSGDTRTGVNPEKECKRRQQYEGEREEETTVCSGNTAGFGEMLARAAMST